MPSPIVKYSCPWGIAEWIDDNYGYTHAYRNNSEEEYPHVPGEVTIVDSMGGIYFEAAVTRKENVYQLRREAVYISDDGLSSSSCYNSFPEQTVDGISIPPCFKPQGPHANMRNKQRAAKYTTRKTDVTVDVYGVWISRKRTDYLWQLPRGEYRGRVSYMGVWHNNGVTQRGELEIKQHKAILEGKQ